MARIKFVEAFFEMFRLFYLRYQIFDEFDYLDQGSMTIAECEAYFYTLSRYSTISISLKFEQIQKFVTRL